MEDPNSWMVYFMKDPIEMDAMLSKGRRYEGM